MGDGPGRSPPESSTPSAMKDAMALGAKRYSMEDTSGGVCQFEELARKNQFADASNLWSSPDGQAETRPGYSRKASYITYTGAWSLAAATDSTGAAFPQVPNGVGDTLVDFGTTNPYVYLGGSGGIWTPANVFGKACTGENALLGPQLAGSITEAQYWTGTEWRDWPLTPDGLDYIALPVELTKPNSLLQSTRFKFPFRYYNIVSVTLPLSVVNIINMPAVNYRTLVGYLEAGYQTGKNVLTVINPSPSGFVGAQIANQDSALSLDFVCSSTDQCLPPSLAVVPEFNTAFVAYGGNVYECPYGGQPVEADIDRRDEIVYKIGGIKSPYYDGRDGDVVSAPNAPGYVPQLTAFPKANFVLYHQGQLFLAGDPDNPATLRWGAPAQDGAYKVFPVYAFENISTSDDDSGITAIAAFQENVAVFKRDSIWLASFSGLNFLSLPMYKLQKIVSGTGCVAHDSIVSINGYLYFRAEDGFYRFTGTAVEKLSVEVDNAFKELDVTRAKVSSATAITQRNCYLCAARLNNGDTRVFVYDYKRNAWWFWDDLPAQTMSAAEDSNDNNIAVFTTIDGSAYQLTSTLDQVRAIKTSLQTWRIGDDGFVKTLRAVRVNADQTVSDIGVGVQVSDENLLTYNLNFDADAEEKLGETLVLGSSKLCPARKRERRLDLLQSGRWVQLQLTTFVRAATKYWSIVLDTLINGTR